jgi:pectin methylesterase-like acyl-CoA thioesterase
MCETWSVNGTGKADFNTVQGAIDAASNGNDIIVIPRTYIATGEYVIVGNWGYCP